MAKHDPVNKPAPEICTCVPGLPQCPHPMHTEEGRAERGAAAKVRLDAWWKDYFDRHGTHGAPADGQRRPRLVAPKLSLDEWWARHWAEKAAKILALAVVV